MNPLEELFEQAFQSAYGLHFTLSLWCFGAALLLLLIKYQLDSGTPAFYALSRLPLKLAASISLIACMVLLGCLRNP